jgi:hypothetical protein
MRRQLSHSRAVQQGASPALAAPASEPTCGACARGASRAVQVVNWVEREVKVNHVVNPARDVQPPAQHRK